MTTSISPYAGDIAIEPIAADLDRQIVRPSQANPIATPGEGIELTLQYTTSPDNLPLTGLGLRMHYDATALSFQALTAVLADGWLLGADPGPEPQDDQDSDYDQDPRTDRYISLAWLDDADVADWPDVALPADLFTASFLAADNFSGTTIRFSVSSAPPGIVPDVAAVFIATAANPEPEPKPVPEPAALAPNVFAILTSTTPAQIVGTDTVLQVIDAPGAQTMHMDHAAALHLQASDGANVITFPGAAATFAVAHSVVQVTLVGDGGEQVVLDARPVPQTLVFTDGAVSLAIQGGEVRLGDQTVTEAFQWIAATLDDTQTTTTLLAASETLPPPAQPNIYSILTSNSPVQWLANGTYASIVDAPGQQIVHLGAGAALSLEATDGENVMVLSGLAEDYTVTRSIAKITVLGTEGGRLDFTARPVPQVLVFADGAVTIQIDQGQVMLGEQVVNEGAAQAITATLSDDPLTLLGTAEGLGILNESLLALI